MATRTSQFNLPNPTTGAQEIHHFETEVGQVVGLKEKFRQPSTAYAVGNIAYHSALPTGWYLECTTAGTSGSGELTISSPTVGGTVSDGTVTWAIRQIANKRLNGFVAGSLDSSQTSASIRSTRNDVGVEFIGGPSDADSPSLILEGNARTGSDKGTFLLCAATTAADRKILMGYPSGLLMWMNNDLAGSAIVAKSIGANGYIKYASGLILQWGFVATNGGSGTKSFPIAFNNSNITMAGNHNGSDARTNVTFNSISTTQFKANTNQTGDDIYFFWFAIGY